MKRLQAGWALGTIFLFLSASGAIIGISLLFKSAFRVRGTDSSFSKIADKCLPAVGWLIDLAVGIKCTGTECILYTRPGTLLMDLERWPWLSWIPLGPDAID
jgi:amino acid permease